jgi:hypothetical protein
MSATVAGDFAFAPKVWQDHIRAYFDRKLVYGAFALRDESLKPDAGKGETVNFPYFKAIGAAEEPAESAGLVVDKLQDDSFSASVKEVGKAVGIKKKAFKKSAATSDRIVSEIQEQIGRVMAEKVDGDLLTEFSTSGNYTDGFTATGAGDVMTIKNLNKGKVVAFGDKADQAVVLFMHSLQLLDLQNDSTAGFMQATANDPMFGLEGFKGRLLGMAVVTVDTIPNNGGVQIASKDAYNAFIHKPNAYGIIVKQDMEIERDYDILAREWVITGNEWYGVKSFHSKVASLDKRTARLTTTVS